MTKQCSVEASSSNKKNTDIAAYFSIDPFCSSCGKKAGVIWWKTEGKKIKGSNCFLNFRIFFLTLLTKDSDERLIKYNENYTKNIYCNLFMTLQTNKYYE